jgi:hypothetical protein
VEQPPEMRAEQIDIEEEAGGASQLLQHQA